MDYNLLKSSIQYFSYDESKYPFYTLLTKIFNFSPLDKLHLIHDISEQILFENDTSTYFHKKYYKSDLYIEVIKVYYDFIKMEVLPLFNENDFIIQKEPSFRIHLPNNTALGKKETDQNEIIGIHCDGDYGHPAEEINFMLTITGQEGSNSVFAESEPNKGDFVSVTINRGQFVSFYGNQCRHYNIKNTTGKTRISFDFRVIPKSLYKESNASAVHSNRKFIVGEYYTNISINA
jgi:hypothetical protein